MRDLMDEVYEAKKLIGSWNGEEVFKLIEYFKKDNPNSCVQWDWGSGEEGCAFIANNQLIAYVHTKFPICFSKKEFHIYKEILSYRLWFVSIDDFYKNEWFVDLDKLRQEVPDINWLASKDAVDPESFSIAGFRFATH